MGDKNDTQLIICPKCEGSGNDKAGLSCTNCGGVGCGSFFQGKFIYWGLKIGRATIKLRHFKKAINIFINISFFTIGLFGLLSLGLMIYFYPQKLNIFTFWKIKHYYILFFWIGMLAELFVYYKLNVERDKQEKITRFSNKTPHRLPNNWDELKIFKQKKDISRNYHENTMVLLENSFELAQKQKNKAISPKHLLFSLLKNQEFIALLIRLDVDIEKLINKLKQKLEQASDDASSGEVMTVEIKEILIEAYIDAYQQKQDKVTPIALLNPLLKKDIELEELFIDLGVDRNKIKNAVAWFMINEQLIKKYKKYKKLAKLKPGKNMNRAYTAVATPILDHFGYDLTIAAKLGRLEMCIDREKEIDSVFENIESGFYGLILTGESGVGKKNIINGLAQKMVEEDVPVFMRDKRLVELDVPRILSGASPEKTQERLLLVIDEVIKSKNIILFIENIENIIGISSGQEESLELSEVLADSLNRKQISCIAVSSNENYSKYIEKKPLGEVMKKIEIKEPSIDSAIQIVESKIGFLENKFKIYFSYNAIEAAVKLTDKYIKDKFLPEKAINVIELTSANISKRCQADSKRCMCTENDIAKTINRLTNIPTQKITETESEKLLNLEDHIHEKMVNQNEAVAKVASSLRRARAEMREKKRPIASFLFLGPTGVGKTELAKIVSEIYFGGEKNMIRLDMSEYQLQESVKKMIGDPDGIMGYLTEQVRKKPFSLILLDEFEKAHSDILNLFLQVMDDGRLTDGQGKTIDFTNSIIVATSNVGAVYIQNEIEKNTDLKNIKEEIINEHLNKVLKPELINRFDDIVVFKPLSEKNMIDIAKIMLKKTSKMLEEKSIGLEWSEEGVLRLAREGHDPKYGARPLRRLIQNKIEDNIADLILSKKITTRDVVFINNEAEIEIIKANKI